MSRKERVRFEDQAAALARALGFGFEDLPAGLRREVLDDARERRLNAHEAALALSFARVDAAFDDDLERARSALERTALIGAEWVREALADRVWFEAHLRLARAALRTREDRP